MKMIRSRRPNPEMPGAQFDHRHLLNAASVLRFELRASPGPPPEVRLIACVVDREGLDYAELGKTQDLARGRALFDDLATWLGSTADGVYDVQARFAALP